MADNKKIAEDVLAAVGGPDNITSATHCMTRLRLNLKDQSVPDDDQVKKIPGVLGAQWSGGQYQVIIGQNVPKVYEEAIKLGVTGEGAIDEDLGDAEPEKLTVKSAANNVLNYLSKSMVALIPAMLSAAMFRTVGVIFGDMLGIWATDGELYNLFYNWLYNAFFYFLPVILGWSAAKQLGASPVLGMMLGGVLIAPEFMDLIDAAAETGATTTAIYGIFPATLNDYSSSVLPVILSMPVLWQVEKFFKRVIPDMLSTIFVPFLTMLVVVPVSLCVLAPIGTWLGDLIGTVMFTLGSTGGIVTIVALVVVSACWSYLVMTGMHVTLITLGIVQLAQSGSDPFVFVAGMIAQWATWGIALGAFLRLKDKDEKNANLGYFLSGLLGGVTEPALYGCGFKYGMRPFLGMMAGGAVGGLIAALTGATVYVAGSSNVLSILCFVGGSTANLVWAVVACVAALVVSTVVTFLFGFSKEDLEADAANAQAKLEA